MMQHTGRCLLSLIIVGQWSDQCSVTNSTWLAVRAGWLPKPSLVVVDTNWDTLTLSSVKKQAIGYRGFISLDADGRNQTILPPWGFFHCGLMTSLWEDQKEHGE